MDGEVRSIIVQVLYIQCSVNFLLAHHLHHIRSRAVAVCLEDSLYRLRMAGALFTLLGEVVTKIFVASKAPF